MLIVLLDETMLFNVHLITKININNILDTLSLPIKQGDKISGHRAVARVSKTHTSRMSLAVKEFDIGPQDPSDKFKIDDSNLETNQQSPETQDAPRQEQSSPRPGSIHIPFLDRLRALPEVRSIPWRLGQELPPERSIDSPRVQQRGAILLSTRGTVSPSPCEHCAAGYGRFSVCITLELWFQGACSSCIFTSKGNKCSLRFQTSGM
jgi:hypothetical protein